MADIGLTGAVVIAAGWSGRKLAGPLFDEIAEGWREQYSNYRKRNLNRIGTNAERKVQDARIGTDQDTWVSPRVLAQAMDAGSWCEGPVAAEYFGGILASSVSPYGASDRGMSWAVLLSQLPTSAIHLHYLIYKSFRDLYLGREIPELGLESAHQRCQIFLPAEPTRELMNLRGRDDDPYSGGELPSAVRALMAHSLLGFGLISTVARLTSKLGVEIPTDGLVVTPTGWGMELFLWAHGCGWMDYSALLDPSVPLDSVEGLASPVGAVEVATLEACLRDHEDPR